MKKFLRDVAGKNRLLVSCLAVLVAVGAMFLMFGGRGGEPRDVLRDNLSVVYSTHVESFGEQDDNDTDDNYFLQERALEERLEEFFSLVEGAGRVRVMVSPMTGGETVFATDTSESRSYMMEYDAQGGSRDTRQHQHQSQTVLVNDRQGTDTPLIVREVEPRVHGIVIIAEGGDCPFVRDALTRAARAVLGLDAHMIQVLTMKGE